MNETITPSTRAKGFTVIELLVAVAVTALLSGMLLLISTQVLETQSKSASTLETNQIAHFVLDQIQEDLQCALYRNDGNVWMAISLLNESENSGSWVNPSISSNGKSPNDSLRIVNSDWTGEELKDSEIDALGQGPFFKSRFGVAGCWLRFFSQSPELDLALLHLEQNINCSDLMYRLKILLRLATTYTQMLKDMALPHHQALLTQQTHPLPEYLSQ